MRAYLDELYAEIVPFGRLADGKNCRAPAARPARAAAQATARALALNRSHRTGRESAHFGALPAICAVDRRSISCASFGIA
jgi:hypothetical protein